MQNTCGHFLLLSEAAPRGDRASFWRFVLEDLASRERLAASDEEPNESPERAELLAVVRGLEALDGPSRVTLVTTSRYVWRGLQSGLGQWRDGDFHWEHFGRRVPVRDHDLWRRLDRAMQIHAVQCRPFRCDAPQSEAAQASAEGEPENRCAEPTQDRAVPATAAPTEDKCSPRAACRTPGVAGSCEPSTVTRTRRPQLRKRSAAKRKQRPAATAAKQFLHGAAALVAPLLPHGF